MPLATEAIEAGLFTVSERTRRFFLDWRADLYAKIYTPIEDRPGAADAIAEMKALFADGFSCQEFKDKLYAMGAFGCARSRRLKAIAAILGLKDEDVEDCLAEPRKEPGPQVYYLPPEDITIERVSLPEPTDEDTSWCEAPGAQGITDPADALCPTDTGKGCTEPDGEDTDDLPDTNDCDAASEMLRGIADLFPTLLPGQIVDRTDQEDVIREAGTLPQIPDQFPTQEEEDNVTEILPSLSRAFPLYSPRTYLDALYTAINIHDHPKFANCDQVITQAEELIDDINKTILSLPRGYINPTLLPKGFEIPTSNVKQRPPKLNVGLSIEAGTRARQAAASARRRRAIQGSI